MLQRGSGDGLWRLPAIRRLVWVTILGFTGFFATLASLPWWAVRGGVGAGSAGLVTTVLLAATVAVQPLVPWLVARIGHGRALALGLLALGLPSPLYGLTSDLVPMLAVSAVRGMGFAVLTVVGATLTAVLAPAGRHGEAAGLYGLAIALPNLAAVPGAVALAQNAGYWPVAVLATLPVVAAPFALRLSAGHPHTRGGRAGSHRAAVRASAAPSIVLLAVTLAGGGLVTFVPIELPDGLVATAALLVFGVTAAAARWRAGVLADRVGTRLLLPAFVLTSVVGMAGVAAGLATGSVVLLLAGAAVFGVGYGAVQNLTLVIAFARAGEGGTATASAVWNAAFDAGTGIGALVVGMVATAGLGVPGALGLSGLLVVATLPLVLGLRPADGHGRAAG